MADPDVTLTVRQAFEKHYLKDELSPLTISKHRHLLTMWEKLTRNPPIGEITDQTLEEFRAAALEQYSPRSVVTIWRSVKAILRRVGPRSIAPGGLGIIDSMPYMRPVRIRYEPPRRVPLEDIARVYVHAMTLQRPRPAYCSPCEWWRCLLVMAYVTGFRRCDLFSLTWEQIDMQEGTIDFRSQKTGKCDLWPLHPVALTHLARIRDPDPAGGHVFRAAHRSRSGSSYKVLRQLCDGANVEYFSLHHIRKTAASEIERVRPGMAPTFLQHVPRDVTDRHYLNRHRELADAILAMRLPIGFGAGPKSQQRREERLRKERLKIRIDELSVPTGPNPAEWQFRHGQFCFRGEWYPLPSPLRMAILRLLVSSGGPVHFEEIETLCRKLGAKVVNSRWVHVRVSQVRNRLRKCLGLGGFDPVPCVSRGDGGAWTITIP